jgi:hypothetical protein
MPITLQPVLACGQEVATDPGSVIGDARKRYSKVHYPLGWSILCRFQEA